MAAALVDTGAWIALLRPGDHPHREVCEPFRWAMGGCVPFFTTNLAIAEVHCSVPQRAGTRAAAVALETRRPRGFQHAGAPEAHRGVRTPR